MKQIVVLVTLSICLFAALCCSGPAYSDPAVIYVTPTGNDGSAGYPTWSDAKATVDAAIELASTCVPCAQVWVMEGTYDQYNIRLRDGVGVYGGFPTGTPAWGDRNSAEHTTVLRRNGGSAGSVVVMYGTVTNSAVIDGFTITGGNTTNGGGINCADQSPTISNNRIERNQGTGAIYVTSGAPVITKNVIINNSGGAICTGAGSFCVISNCHISGNFSGSNAAGGLYCAGAVLAHDNVITGNIGSGVSCRANSTFTNNTIVGNYGEGLLLSTASFVVSNNIVAFNKTYGVRKGSGTVTLNNNCVSGNQTNYYGVSQGANDITADPKLADVSYGNIHIQPNSPCIGAGYNDAVDPAWTDMDDESRNPSVGHTVDIGADESDNTRWTLGPYLIVRVSLTGDDDNDGSTWDLAKSTIQTAISAAAFEPVSQGGGDVWVKAGTYNQRIWTYSYVRVYGHFAGTEPDKSWRNLASTDTTTLNGQQGGTVVTMVSAVNASALDGFTVTGGTNAMGIGGGINAYAGAPTISHNWIQSNSASYGGGIGASGSSPVVSNCFIISNQAGFNGGGHYGGGTITNCTITGNFTSTGNGGGIMIAYYAGSPTVYNSIIAYNEGGYGVYSDSPIPVPANIYYSDVVSNYPGNYYPASITPPAGYHDISVNPQLNILPFGAYMHLNSNSPCIGVGLNTATGIPATDCDGEPRIMYDSQGEVVDMGADEFTTTYPTGSIGWAKDQPVVQLTAKVVTAVLPSATSYCFYVQDATEPASGIKVVPLTPLPLERGSVVNITGSVACDGAECYIKASSVRCTNSHILPTPITVTNAATAGRAIGQQPRLYVDTTRSIVGCSVNRVGKMVSVTGSLMETGYDVHNHPVCWIDDGTGVVREGHFGLKVVYWNAADAPNVAIGQTVNATGVIGAEPSDGQLPVPVIHVTDQTRPGVIYVKIDGDDQYDGSTWALAKASINEAIFAAEQWNATNPEKKEVWVAGSVNAYQETATVGLRGSVAVYGGFAGTETLREQRDWVTNETTIDGQGFEVAVSAQCLTEFARIDGFKVTNAESVGILTSGLADTASVVIANNNVTQNVVSGISASYGTYATPCMNGKTPVIFSNSITYNGDQDFSGGGGIACSAGSPPLLVVGNVISHNTAYAGGGVACDALGSIYAVDNEVSYNTCGDDDYGFGGGFYLRGHGATLIGNDIHHNAAMNGGGISCQIGEDTIYEPILLANNLIHHNSATNRGETDLLGYGGGIECWVPETRILNNTICSNVSDPDGDYLGGGGGAILTVGCKAIVNNIVYGNSSIFRYYDPEYDPPKIVANNYYDDPSFSYEYRLSANSPCKDAGHPNDDYTAGCLLDYYGNARKRGANVDIGAYEADGCIPCRIEVTADDGCAILGSLIALSARAYDFFSNPIYDRTVTFSIPSGPGSVSPASASITRQTGAVTTVTSASTGTVDVVAEMDSTPYCPTEATTRVGFFFTSVPTDSWPMFQHDLGHSGTTGAAVAALTKEWWLDLNGNTSTDKYLWSSPVVADGWVYVGASDAAGTVYALPVDGSTLYTQTVGGPVYGAPSIDTENDRVYVNATYPAMTLNALSAGTQQQYDPLYLDWSKGLIGTDLYGSPVIYPDEDAAYVSAQMTITGGTYTVDLTGSHDVRGATYSTASVLHATPAIDTSFAGGARFYVGDVIGRVTAGECDTGTAAWDYPGYVTIGGLANLASSCTIVPTASATYVFGGSRCDYGGPIWGGIYRFVDQGDASGEPGFIDTFPAPIYSTIATYEGNVFFGGLDGYMYCMDATYLTSVWQSPTRLGSPVYCSALISEPTRTLFVCTESAVLYGLDIDDGSIVFSYDFSKDMESPKIMSSLAASDGRLFVVVGNAERHRLYCFKS